MDQHNGGSGPYRKPDGLGGAGSVDLVIEKIYEPGSGGGGSTTVTGRLYLPTLAELIDRLAITQLKAVFIPEHAEAYRAEMALIMHDVDMILREQPPLDAEGVRAVLILMLANRFIWENEAIARAGGADQDRRLKATHSINGVRNNAKNVIASKTGGRKDYKTDSLAADLPAEFGNWDVFK